MATTACVLSSDPVPLGDAGSADASDNTTLDAGIDAPPPIFAGGTATAVSDQWSAVTLPRTFTSPIVIATPSYDAASPPLVARVRNVGGAAFELRVDRLDGSADPVEPVTVHYVAVEEGVYEAATDGVTMEAVRVTAAITDSAASWTGITRGYTNTYTAPVVLGQVMTAEDAWSAFWARGAVATDPPGPAALFVGKHVGADPVSDRADETIGYLVIEAGAGRIDGVDLIAGLGDDVIQGIDNAPPFAQATAELEGAAVAVLSPAGMDGGDGCWPLLYGPDAVASGALQLAVDEDQLVDLERSHTTEQVAYLIFAP